MENTNRENHKHIEHFNPDVQKLRDVHQDFLYKTKIFNAGNGYENFNEFLAEEAIDFADSGDGVTYIIWNIFSNDEGEEIRREIVAFYTLQATAIPYEDCMKLEPEEAAEAGTEYDIEICGIPAIEIKMFAVNQKYQDLFYEYEGTDLPISAWVLQSIIDSVYDISKNDIGCKAIFLHSVPDAENFYIKNKFQRMKINMNPFHSIDSEFTAMYLPLCEITMHYEKEK